MAWPARRVAISSTPIMPITAVACSRYSGRLGREPSRTWAETRDSASIAFPPVTDGQ